MTFPSQHVSVSINRSAVEVYEFAANPATWPTWAAGLSGSMEQSNGDWVAQSPMGRVTVQFAERNPFGILDHVVTLPSGDRVYNPLRVFPNADGSEVVFTVYQRPDMSPEMFSEDAQAVARDLATLKALLET